MRLPPVIYAKGPPLRTVNRFNPNGDDVDVPEQSRRVGAAALTTNVSSRPTKPAAELAESSRTRKDPDAERERLYGGQSGYTELVETTPAGERVVRKSAKQPRDLYADQADHRFLIDGRGASPRKLAEAVAPRWRRSAVTARMRLGGVRGRQHRGGTRADGFTGAVRLGLLDTLTN